MVLTEEQVLNIVKEETPHYIEANIHLQDAHKLHITGKNYQGALQEIVGYESAEQFKQKKILSKPFTRPLLTHIIDSLNRWKNAQGTSKYYKFTTENSETQKKFKDDVLSKVWKGKSMDFFTKEFLSQARFQDFNGYFIVERTRIDTTGERDSQVTYETREGKTRVVANTTTPTPYIIFIEAEDIKAFGVTGQKTEWICYELKHLNTKETKYYRVLDDKNDYVVEYSTDNASKYAISTTHETIQHKAGQCPAVNVTFRNKYLNFDHTKTSSLDDLIDILDNYLQQFAAHGVSCNLHNLPIYYQLGQKCKAEHHGSPCTDGRIIYEDPKEGHIDVACTSCKGTGHNIHKDASTVLIIPPKDPETGAMLDYSNVAGYITPPIDILAHQMTELDWTKAMILDAALGAGNMQQQDSVSKTATEVTVNMKPLEAKISDQIDDIEAVERDLTNVIGKLMYQDKYVDCEIHYGRKLNLRDENTLLDEIKKAKESGSSYYHIKTLCEELIYTRHAKSPVDLERNILLNELEPLVGFTFSEVDGSANLSESTKYLKQNFVDLISQFEEEYGAIEAYEKNKQNKERIKSIKEKLTGYVTAASKQQPANSSGLDELGKLPLALQQLALARERARAASDTDLVASLGSKMDELLKRI